ncbi:MAG: DUF819 family protein [Bacteroidales bacterium]|jgi:uncharacterized membrane protein|nr:DUF819 family protein [Bacteroidales bacterium]
MPIALLIIIYILSPALILYACKRFKWVENMGAVLWAYLLGIILGNFNLLPENAAAIQDMMTTLTVPLAIPLMLFSSNIRDWKQMARSTLLSLTAGIIGVLIAIFLGFLLLRNSGVENLEKVSGMLVGVYTGGTPNLAALKLMLNIDSATYVTMHTYDMLVSFVFLIFMITIGQRVLGYLLPKTKKNSSETRDITDNDTKLLLKAKIKAIASSMIVAIIIFAVAGGVSLLFDASQQMVIVILTITSLGIAASFNKKINATPLSFESGMYLILIFSVVVASMVDIQTFITEPPTVFYYILFTVFVSLFLQMLISRLFKIDVDTTIVVSTSLICSPAFVPFVATAIHNKKVIVGGITAGLIGFAIGNYLGFAISKLLTLI